MHVIFWIHLKRKTHNMQICLTSCDMTDDIDDNIYIWTRIPLWPIKVRLFYYHKNLK